MEEGVNLVEERIKVLSKGLKRRFVKTDLRDLEWLQCGGGEGLVDSLLSEVDVEEHVQQLEDTIQ